MRRLVLTAGCLLAAGVAASQQADGSYPAVLACDGSGGAAPLRARVSVNVSGTQARYEFRSGALQETGSGQFSGRTLTLRGSGRGPSGGYQAQYSGEVTGRGGLLTGQHAGAGGSRRGCQLVLGDG